MDIDEILARAEKVEAKEGDDEGESNELLSAFKVSLWYVESFYDCVNIE